MSDNFSKYLIINYLIYSYILANLYLIPFPITLGLLDVATCAADLQCQHKWRCAASRMLVAFFIFLSVHFLFKNLLSKIINKRVNPYISVL